MRVFTCSGPECDRPLTARSKTGLCRSHYKQAHLGKPLTPLAVATKDLGRPKVCSFDGCDNPHKARGYYCRGHAAHIAAGREPRVLQLRRAPGPCSVDGCDAPRLANNLCATHNMRHIQRWRSYGLTPDQGLAMHESQERACGGCRRPMSLDDLCIDHDHTCCPRGSCGSCVRGLLCSGCNFAAGHAGDDPARLRGLADYLERQQCAPEVVI